MKTFGDIAKSRTFAVCFS